MQPGPVDQFVLPVYIDLGATFLYALSGALIAIRRHYDFVGVFVLALVTAIGGALIRDGVFIQSGPPLVMVDRRYLLVIAVACLMAALFRKRVETLQKGFVLADALGLGAYAVVGVTRSLNAGLSGIAAITVGVINAVGGGLLRDVLVREEPLLFKPGQYYVVAVLLAACLFIVEIRYFAKSVESAALLAILCGFLFRLLAVMRKWETTPLGRPRATEPKPDRPAPEDTTL